jgi:hypothetical protein
MKDTKKKKPTEYPDANYNPTGRDFQRTDKDIDAVSESEKERKDENENTKRGNTTPDKNKIN